MKLNALDQMLQEIDTARDSVQDAYDSIEDSREMLENAMAELRTAVEDFEYWRQTNHLQVAFVNAEGTLIGALINTSG